MFIITIHDEVILDDKSSSCCPVASVLCSTGEFLGENICIHIVSHLYINFLFLSPPLTPHLPFGKVHLMNNGSNEGSRRGEEVKDTCDGRLSAGLQTDTPLTRVVVCYFLRSFRSMLGASCRCFHRLCLWDKCCLVHLWLSINHPGVYMTFPSVSSEDM